MDYLYYTPEQYGLKPVYDWDFYDEAYEFSILAVWKHEDGKVYAAFDSGCSCPVPFEDHKFPEDFVEVKSWEDVKAIIAENEPSYCTRKPIPPALRESVKRALA